MADSKDGSSAAKCQTFCWKDEDIKRLIDLCEARPCLRDIADPTYSKKDVWEKALSEIKEELGIEIKTIRSRWNSLRAQHGRELGKEMLANMLARFAGALRYPLKLQKYAILSWNCQA